MLCQFYVNFDKPYCPNYPFGRQSTGDLGTWGLGDLGTWGIVYLISPYLPRSLSPALPISLSPYLPVSSFPRSLFVVSKTNAEIVFLIQPKQTSAY